MQQLDGGKVLSLEDMRQEISYTVDMLDLAGSAPARDFRFGAVLFCDSARKMAGRWREI